MDTLLAAIMVFVPFALGYILGRIKKQKDDYDDGYFNGHFDALYEEQKRKEEQTRLPVPPDKWETPLG